MRTLTATLIALITIVYLASAQSHYDDSLPRRQTAERIQRRYGMSFDASRYSLSQLLDLEGRLGTVARIKRNFGLNFDYRTNSLSALLDIEGRIGTARRIRRTYGADYDWRSHSLADLLAAEARLSQRAQPRIGAAVQGGITSPLPILPTTRSTASRRSNPSGFYVSPGGGHWVQNKTDDGSIVTLEDGSVWQIDPLDQIDTALWLPITEITVVETSGDYLLINTDDGEKAHARLLHQ